MFFGFFRIAPETRLTGFFLLYLYLLDLSVDVKDASSGQVRALQDPSSVRWLPCKAGLVYEVSKIRNF